MRYQHGNTPLILAARYGEDEIVQALISSNADIFARNNVSYT